MTELLLMALAGFGGTELVKNFFAISRWLKSALTVAFVVAAGIILRRPVDLDSVVWMFAAVGGAFLAHRLYRILRVAGDHHVYLMIRNR